MGQRHQIILVLPRVYYNKGNPNNRGERVIAIHHQWLYGQNAAYFLRQFLKFHKVADPYKFEHNAMEILKTIYSIDIEFGYYHQVHELGIANPETFDNNDGCTIIDIRKKKPKYCFFSINGLESESPPKVDDMMPMSEEEYLDAYNAYDSFKTPINADLLTLFEFKEIMILTKMKNVKVKCYE